jgi:hypothetical protein
MTSKRQLIEDIRKFNATASEEFLTQFDEQALQQYLNHLREAQQKLPRIATWTRKPMPVLQKFRMAS